MSKLGRKPITILEGVTVTKQDRTIKINGPLGDLEIKFPQGIEVEIAGSELKVERKDDSSQCKANQGTFVRIIGNAINGVRHGFTKELEVVGTGFRAQMEGNDLVLSLGFSHPVRYATPEGVKIETQDNKIKVSSVNKEKVGLVARQIKDIKKPDAYKGKGIRYLGEKLKLKPGKAAAKAGADGGAK